MLETTLVDKKGRRLLTKGQAIQIPPGFIVIWAYAVYPGMKEAIPSAWSLLPESAAEYFEHVRAHHYRFPQPFGWGDIDDLLPTKTTQN